MWMAALGKILTLDNLRKKKVIVLECIERVKGAEIYRSSFSPL